MMRRVFSRDVLRVCVLVWICRICLNENGTSCILVCLSHQATENNYNVFRHGSSSKVHNAAAVSKN